MSRPGVRAKPVAHFSRLESAVMAALAAELRHAVPDLAAQFRNARPGLKRNMAVGYYCGLTGDSVRPATTADGALGSVHVLIDGLRDAVAFRVLMRQGRAVAIEADSYGQDTRAIDFTTVPFDQVFTLNDQGDSIPFDPAALMRPSPLLALHQHEDDDLAATVEMFDRSVVNRGPLERLQDDRPSDLMALLSKAPQAEPDPEAVKSLMIGIWTVVAVVAFIAVILFRVSFVVVIVGAIWLGAILRKPGVRTALAHAAKALGRAEFRPS